MNDSTIIISTHNASVFIIYIIVHIRTVENIKRTYILLNVIWICTSCCYICDI